MPDQTEPIVWDMIETGNGDIWLATMYHGLFVSRSADLTINTRRKFTRVLEPNNLFSTVYALEKDDQGYIWCSTDLGLVKIHATSMQTQKFSHQQGLQLKEFDFGVSHKDQSGYLYFGGSKGYTKFDPTIIDPIQRKPRLLFTSITMSEAVMRSISNLLNLTKIQLTHKDYFIQFEFSVLDFLDPEKNQYRYKLEGFDRSWVDNGTRNTATYTSLPAGKYTLRVQGANSAGIWNRDGLSIEIEVLPAPWLTWWAFTLYALGAMFLVWLATRTFFSFVVERRANEMALEMVEVAEQADDEMLEQLEIHDDLVKSVYRHSVATLELVSELMTIRGSSLTDDNACEVVQASVSRVEALALLEECLYYQGEFLLADMNKFINLLIPNLLKKSFLGEEKITTINEVISQPFPIEQASPLAIILFELLENSIQHGFVEIDRPNYLHIVLAPDQADDVGGQFRLVVEDNGAGIPPNIDPLSAPTNGLSIVVAMTRRLSGTLQVTNRNGTRVSVVFPAIGNMWRESAG